MLDKRYTITWATKLSPIHPNSVVTHKKVHSSTFS